MTARSSVHTDRRSISPTTTAEGSSFPTNRPNILIIMTDQQRYDSLGCYGATCIETPNIDRLAREGMLFERCYVNNPVCTPSRASMYTGKPIYAHGVKRLHDVLPDDEVLFTKHLQTLGYHTALFGKLHVSGRIREEQQRHPHDGFDEYAWCMEASISMDSPFNGFSRWLKEKDPAFHARLKSLGRKLTHIPRDYHFTHWAAQQTCDFIEAHGNSQKQHSGSAHSEDTPFFCMMSVFDPHNPYDDLPIEYLERVDQAKLPMPQVDAHERSYRIRALSQEQQDGYLGPISSFSADDIREIRTGYYGSIALLDDEVGRVLEVLDRTGLADSTMVVFLSDHGDMLGDHALLVKGAFFHDPCTRVPLIIRQPGVVPSGVSSPALVQPSDIAATVLHAAMMDPDMIRDIMPASRDIRRATSACHDYVVCAYRGTGIDATGRYFNPVINATMITDGHMKLSVYHPVQGVDTQEEGQLFDLVNDPSESVDLWPGEDTVAMHSLRSALDIWLAEEACAKEQGRPVVSALPASKDMVENRVKLACIPD